MFGCIEGVKDGDTIVPAVIENVFVTNGIVKGINCGGIVGKGNYMAQISHCWNGATIEGTDVGGIAGTDFGSVFNCYNIGNVSGTKAGGIVGNKVREIAECYNQGEITAEGNNASVGGILAYATGNLNLTNCYNTGSLSASSFFGNAPFVGGIVGFMMSGDKNVTNCYNVGEVASTNHLDCLIGYVNNNAYLDIERCYCLNTCLQCEFGILVSAEDMREPFFTDLLNLENDEPVWGMDEDNLNNGFPILVRNNLSVNETKESLFTVYPNPNHGQFTVEGTGLVRISNLMGQVVSTCEIDGRQTLSLPKGMYFITLNGKTAKVVVE